MAREHSTNEFIRNGRFVRNARIYDYEIRNESVNNCSSHFVRVEHFFLRSDRQIEIYHFFVFLRKFRFRLNTNTFNWSISLFIWSTNLQFVSFDFGILKMIFVDERAREAKTFSSHFYCQSIRFNVKIDFSLGESNRSIAMVVSSESFFWKSFLVLFWSYRKSHAVNSIATMQQAVREWLNGVMSNEKKSQRLMDANETRGRQQNSVLFVTMCAVSSRAHEIKLKNECATSVILIQTVFTNAINL